MTSDDVSRVVGCHVQRARVELQCLFREGRVLRELVAGDSRQLLYRLNKDGRRFLDAERRRVACEFLGLLERAKGCGGFPRLDLLEQMEESLRKGSV